MSKLVRLSVVCDRAMIALAEIRLRQDEEGFRPEEIIRRFECGLDLPGLDEWLEIVDEAAKAKGGAR